MVKEFNTSKAIFIGSSAAQVSKIPNLTGLLIKSWIIEEAVGSDSRSLKAWKIDPAQVNVPGDWSAYKQSTGLTAPAKRNEGTIDTNLKTAIIWLTRKGFKQLGSAWNKSNNKINKGLINRRNAEWNIYTKGIYQQW